MTDLERRLAGRLAALRQERGWSLEEVAGRAGLSRATLSRIERGESAPTAGILGKLTTLYGWTLSRLMATVESDAPQLIRAAEQAHWRDPETGFERQVVSPPGPGLAMEMLRGRLPAGARIHYDSPPVPGMEQHILMLDGRLVFTNDGIDHELAPGDCLRLRLTGSTGFHNPGPGTASYLIAIGPP